jgi:DNA-binding HxlR family transcriptional regulator
MERTHRQPRISAFRLLAEHQTPQILLELIGGALRPFQLEQRLPGLPHSVLMRRLAELVLAGAVRHERHADVPPHAYYALLEAGFELLPIYKAAECWEQHWAVQARGTAPGVATLQLLADEHAVEIIFALAEEPLRPIELERNLPDFGRSATRHRLSHLLCEGLVCRTCSGARVHYALTAGARELRTITMLAAHWGSRWVKDLSLRTPGDADFPRADWAARY